MYQWNPSQAQKLYPSTVGMLAITPSGGSVVLLIVFVCVYIYKSLELFVVGRYYTCKLIN